jgi:HK97 family phage major capsid protein
MTVQVQELIEQIGTRVGALDAAKAEAQAEARRLGEADVLLTQKIDKLATQIADLLSQAQKNESRLHQAETILARPGRGATSAEEQAAELRRQLNDAMRRDVQSGSRVLALTQAMSTGSDPDGGYFVFPVISETIIARLRDQGAMRALGNVQTISRGDAFEEPAEDSEFNSGWVGETQARTATDTGTTRKVRVELREVYANAPLTQQLLDDASIDLAGYVGDRIGETFGRREAEAFISGTGTLRPRGITTYATAATADATRPWGTLQHINTGTSGAFAGSNPDNVFYDAMAALRQGYWINASWLMNRLTLAATLKLRDGQQRSLLSWDLAAAPALTLLGFPVRLDDFMPAVAANSLSIALGDFRTGYRIVDRAGMRMLLDPYSDKPNVQFYATRRVGGAVRQFDAIKFIRFGT